MLETQAVTPLKSDEDEMRLNYARRYLPQSDTGVTTAGGHTSLLIHARYR